VCLRCLPEAEVLPRELFIEKIHEQTPTLILESGLPMDSED
jgi:hypothetical protein